MAINKCILLPNDPQWLKYTFLSVCVFTAQLPLSLERLYPAMEKCLRAWSTQPRFRLGEAKLAFTSYAATRPFRLCFLSRGDLARGNRGWAFAQCVTQPCAESSLDLRLSCFNHSAQASATLNLDKITTIGNKNERRFQHLSLLVDQKSRTSIKIELKFVNNSFPFRPSVISRLEHISNTAGDYFIFNTTHSN